MGLRGGWGGAPARPHISLRCARDMLRCTLLPPSPLRPGLVPAGQLLRMGLGRLLAGESRHAASRRRLGTATRPLGPSRGSIRWRSFPWSLEWIPEAGGSEVSLWRMDSPGRSLTTGGDGGNDPEPAESRVVPRGLSGGLVPGPNPQIHRCSHPLHQMAKGLHRICTYSPVYFKSSPDYL